MSWLKPTVEDGQHVLRLREEHPDLYAYAQVLALALRIDSRLLRNLRSRFFPKSNTELEIELWFSSLIHTRNVQAATMYSGIARVLYDSLKNENSERFILAKAEIVKFTKHWPETDRIEQEMRWAVSEGDEQTLKNNVQRILNTLTQLKKGSEKRELARWVKGLFPTLKPAPTDAEQQWLSQYVVASLGMTNALWAGNDQLQPLPEALIKALPKAKTQQIGLRLRPGILEVLEPEKDLETIEVSVPLPTTVILEFQLVDRINYLSESNSIRQITPFWVNSRINIPENIQSFNLQMLDGSSVQIICHQELSLGKPKKLQQNLLPIVKGEFFGRADELALLNEALRSKHTHILQFIAPGGTGKTKLLRYWLDHTEDIGARLTWSFHSQGISDNKQVSATPFFIYAFSKLSATRTEFITEEEKGEYLADLLRKHRCTLVLDGLEPLQHAKSEMRGELKDRAMRALLKSLATANNTLCIITTRIAVHELSDRAHVTSRSLKNLASEDGVKLLISLGVKGTEIALMRAVKAYGCNALALSLLGNALRIRHEGDVRQRDEIRLLTKAAGNKDNRHAFKVMQAYEDWFAGAPELALLYLLGLFDQPIGYDVMQVLWDANIPNLTANITVDDWLEAIDALRNEHSLLFEHEGNSEQFDCHPLIREYFGKQLRETLPDAWQQAHAELYNYYRSLPDEEQPDTLEEMYPLFRAVEHGCLAGLHQQAFTEIYWKRISREKIYYLAKKGACGDDLSNLIHFFKKPWKVPADELDIRSQAIVLRTAGHRLRALGRIQEAIQPFTEALKRYEQLNDPKEIAITSSNLIEPYLTLGNIKTALRNAERGVIHPDPKFTRRLENVSIFARALHQSGRIKEALEHFIETEKLQHAYAPQYRYLHSLSGFRYSELLLEEHQFEEVLERAHYALKIAEATTPNPLYIGLAKLMLGRLSLLQRQLGEANTWLESAIVSLREAGNQDHLSRSLLARSALYRQIDQIDLARQDLQEVFDIAEPSGMRLHLTDWHLEMARVLLAETPSPDKERTGGVSSVQAGPSVADHVEAAAKLITETGYHRRDKELMELQQHSHPQAFKN